MQDQAAEHWEEMALAQLGRTVDTPDAGDFGWISPFPQILEDCQIVLMTNYHLFPEAGGWHDQTEAFRADFKTYLRGLAQKLHELAPVETPPPGPGEELPSFGSLG